MTAAPRKRLIVEFGSNSCKVFLPSFQQAEASIDYRIPLRLADGILASGKLSSKSIQTVLSTIRDLQKRFGTDTKYILIGTEALRRAKNQSEICSLIQQETGLELRILSVKEEAEAAFRGIIGSLDLKGRIACFDIGGSSTELVTASKGRIDKIHSFPLGAVDLARKFRCKTPVTNCSFYHCEEYISQKLQITPRARFQLVGTGGAVMTCAMVALATNDVDEDMLNGFELKRSELFRQIQLYRALSRTRIAAIPGMDPARADIILPAAMVMIQLMDLFGVQCIITSLRGVRHGIL